MFWRFVFLTLTFFPLFSAPGWSQKQLVDRVVAVVNNEAITQSELDLYLRPLYEELRKQYEGTELSRRLADLRLKLLKQMIEDRLVFQAAEAQKLTLDEAEIDERVSEFKKGFPSERAMEKAMESEGYTQAKLRERYRRQILIRKLHDIEIRSRVVVSPLEIEEFYKKNPSKFAEEESLRVHSITAKKSDAAREKGLTDEAAKRKIEEIEKRVRSGENFEALAVEFSQDEHAREGGDLGWVKRGEMLPAIDSILFGFEARQISTVLETPEGYHLFKVAEKKASRAPPLEEVNEQIRTFLFREKAQKRFEEWMNDLKARAYISIR